MDKSLERAAALIGKAAGESTDLLVFPETWLCGYPVWLDYAPDSGIWNHPAPKILYRLLCENALVKDDSDYKKLSEMAQEAGLMLVMGAQELQGRSLYNSMIFFHPDGSSVLHRKLIPTYTERLIWARGDGSTLGSTEIDGWNIGGLICWEHWMPQARAYMHSLHEHIHIAQWPGVKEMHLIASRHYAFEGQCYVIASGCRLLKEELMQAIDHIPDPKEREILNKFFKAMGTEQDKNLLMGGSAVIGPDGNIMTEQDEPEKSWITVTLEKNSLIEGSMYLDTDGHYSRPDIFQLSVNRNKLHPVITEQDTPE